MAETQQVTTGGGQAPSPTLAQVLLVQGEARQIPLKDESVHCCVTSPPYWNLRDYQTGTWVGGDLACHHLASERWYTENTAAVSSTETFSQPGWANMDRLKQGRWRVSGSCVTCGARRIDNQLGLERVHDCLGWATGQDCHKCYLCKLRQVFADVWRVLHPTGTLWLNIADSYNANGRTGHGTRIGYKQGTNRASATGQDHCRATAPGLKPKDLCGIPQRLALALQADGWTWRSTIIWAKPNPMPNSQQDRPTTSHEYVLLLSKQERYFYDAQAIAEPLADYGQRGTDSTYQQVPNGGDNAGLGALAKRIRQARLDGNRTLTRTARDVWSLATEPCALAHFATMPLSLAERCVKAGTSAYGVCSTCGAPWRRVVERESTQEQSVWSGNARQNGCLVGGGHMGRTGHWTVDVGTKGWEPACTCDAAVQSAVVLDPFAGSGTTGLAARALGRHAVLLDLSWPYLKDIARTRLGLKALEAWEHGATPQPVTYDDLPLFSLGGAVGT